MFPSRAKPKKRVPWSLIALAVWALGCSSTAHLHHRVAAPHPLPGLQRVAILPLAGPPTPTAIAEQAVRSVLQESGEFRVIGSAELALTARQALYCPDGQLVRQVALEAAEMHRVQALLLVQIEIPHTGLKRPGLQNNLSPASELALRCQLEVLAVPHGKVLFVDHVQGTGPSAAEEGLSAKQVLPAHEQLAWQTATALAQRITPHRVSVPVTLLPAMPGEGGSSIRQANALARQGLWNQAMHQWHQAVSQDPHNDVAHYGLGLAMEAQGDFARAAQHYRIAARHADKQVYRQALARLETARPRPSVPQSSFATSLQPVPLPESR